MTKVLYLDLIGGAAGDMLMAALVDAGASLDRVREVIRGMGLAHVDIHTKLARPAGLRARQIDVIIRGELADKEYLPAEVAEEAEAHARGLTITGVVHVPKSGATPHAQDDHAHAPHRSYLDIRAQLEAAPLTPRTRTIALAAFHLLALAEAAAHGVALEEVTFHEVGADDAITDVVGVATAIDELAPDEIVVSPVPVARGLTRGAHGPIPLPAPATLHILTGVPLVETPLRGELVTPTGAALLKAIATRFGAIPSMTVEAIGVGAGHKSWPDRPNVVRALIGRKSGTTAWTTDHECVVETNVDDMNPQHFADLERALFTAGALDVWTTPIHMKKGRPAVQVSALAARELLDAITHTFFTHSTTLGVRVTPVERRRAERTMIEVETRYGTIKVKRSPGAAGLTRWMPEHDDCAARAEAHGVPQRAVWEAALQAALAAAEDHRP